jgi:hypothetical protein
MTCTRGDSRAAIQAGLGTLPRVPTSGSEVCATSHASSVLSVPIVGSSRSPTTSFVGTCPVPTPRDSPSWLGSIPCFRTRPASPCPGFGPVFLFSRAHIKPRPVASAEGDEALVVVTRAGGPMSGLSLTARSKCTAEVRRPEPRSTSSNQSEGLPSDTHAWTWRHSDRSTSIPLLV